jgi:hypothetical protein
MEPPRGFRWCKLHLLKLDRKKEEEENEGAEREIDRGKTSVTPRRKLFLENCKPKEGK